MHLPKIVAKPIQEQNAIRMIMRYTENWSDLPVGLADELADAERDAILHPGAVYSTSITLLPPSQRK
jgi:hypothetical protein